MYYTLIHCFASHGILLLYIFSLLLSFFFLLFKQLYQRLTVRQKQWQQCCQRKEKVKIPTKKSTMITKIMLMVMIKVNQFKYEYFSTLRRFFYLNQTFGPLFTVYIIVNIPMSAYLLMSLLIGGDVNHIDQQPNYIDNYVHTKNSQKYSIYLIKLPYLVLLLGHFNSLFIIHLFASQFPRLIHKPGLVLFRWMAFYDYHYQKQINQDNKLIIMNDNINNINNNKNDNHDREKIAPTVTTTTSSLVLFSVDRLRLYNMIIALNTVNNRYGITYGQLGLVTMTSFVKVNSNNQNI